MGKKILSIILILVVAFTFAAMNPNAFFGVETAHADDLSDLKDELKDVQELKADTKSETVKLAEEIEDLEKEIEAINKKINAKTEEIKATETEIAAKQDEINEQTDNLNGRLVVMYKKGSIGFLDVLLSSRSLSELIYNIKVVQRIYKGDQDVVQILQYEHEELEGIKAVLDGQKKELSLEKTNLTNKKSSLAKQKAALNKKLKEYDEEEEKLTREIIELADKQSGYLGGTILWPLPSKYRTPSRITSLFGTRLHPIYKVVKHHNGTDIGVPKGTEIYAVASGKVIRASYHSSYGNNVMIDHGGGVVSLYAHASKLLVSNGDIVTGGQTIALVGSTGDSTGNHLHLEIRINGKGVDALQYYPELFAYFNK